MNSMVTITHQNRCAEMLATVRRGPFAKATPEERIEYLLTRVRKTNLSVTFADHALEHTLSFQRRVQSIKREFLKRGATTPLGIPQDFWDRTEAQQRGALHAHILVWFRKRQQAKNWQALPPNPRTVSGHGPKQQRLGSVAPQPPQPHHALQHDSCYQLSEMARVSGEMVRPIVRPGDWGGYDVERLRVGALARTVLIRLKYPAGDISLVEIIAKYVNIQRKSRNSRKVFRFLTCLLSKRYSDCIFEAGDENI